MIHGKRVAVALLVRAGGAAAARLVAALPTDVVDEVLVIDDTGHDDEVRRLQAYGRRPRLRARVPDAGGGPVPTSAELLALDAEVVVVVEPDGRDDPRLVSALAAMVASGACDIVVARRAAAPSTRVPAPADQPGSASTVSGAGQPGSASVVPAADQPAPPEGGILEGTGYRACSRAVLEALAQAHGPTVQLDAAAMTEVARLGFRIGTVVGPGVHPAVAASAVYGAAPVGRASADANVEPGASGDVLRPGSASRRAVNGLLAALVLATVLPALLGAAHAVSYARIPTIPVSLVREVTLIAPGVRPLTDLQGLAVTPDGAILVAELGGRRLVELRDGTSGRGVVLASAETPEALQRPFDVAVTPDGLVLVLDQATGLVHRLYRDGRRLPPLPLGSPGARTLAVDAAGAIVVGDTGAGLVRRYRPDGSPDIGWGERHPAGQTPVGEVVGIAFVAGGIMAASGAERGAALLDDAGRVIGRTVTVGNVGPLARLSAERLLMTDLSTNRVWVLDATGRTVGRLVRADGDEPFFFQPRGVAAPGDGCLYVASDMRVGIYRIEQSYAAPTPAETVRRC